MSIFLIKIVAYVVLEFYIILTHFRLNRLHPNYILEESNFNFTYVRL